MIFRLKLFATIFVLLQLQAHARLPKISFPPFSTYTFSHQDQIPMKYAGHCTPKVAVLGQGVS